MNEKTFLEIPNSATFDTRYIARDLLRVAL